MFIDSFSKQTESTYTLTAWIFVFFRSPKVGGSSERALGGPWGYNSYGM